MTSEQPPFPDYYEVLGARPDVSDEELRAARREAVKRWHPDRNTAAEAEEMMRLVNAAWEVLGKPETRAEHDAVYFAWRAAEYARRAATADEVRRGYVRERMERDEREAREAEERRAADEATADGGRGHAAGGSSGVGDWDAGARNGGSDSGGGKATEMMDRVFGVILVGIVVLVGLIAAIAFGRAGLETDGRLAQSYTSSAIADYSHVSTSTDGTLEAIVGDGQIECQFVPIGNTVNFWASSTFRVPTTSSWSVGFLYYNPDRRGSLEWDAATYVYKNWSSGPYAGHWTRRNGVIEHQIGREWIRPQSALNTRGYNTMEIGADESGSYLILNGELQVQVPVALLNPVSSRVKFCVGFFSDEASGYELPYWNLTGRAW